MNRLFTAFFFILFTAFTAQSQQSLEPRESQQTREPREPLHILTGADQMEHYLPLLRGASVAILTNQTAVVGKSHLVDTLLRRGIRITKIFAPEHGFRGQADAGEHVSSQTDPRTGIPIISLYGNKLRPSADDLAGVDIMVFDIQDVGVRWYTYISSLQKYIEAAIENNRPLILLDRPNPNGFYVDGPVLDTNFRSFVGMQPIPVVYGMTLGEYARMLIGEQWLDGSVTGDLSAIHAINERASHIDSLIAAMRRRPVNIGNNDFRLIVIPCRNYTHRSRYVLPVAPSPNLPNMQAVYLYPSLCFFEGTNISLGRGTPKPFQQFGAPSFPKGKYSFTPRSTPGAKNPPLENSLCYGFDLSHTDVARETGNKLSLRWLLQAWQLYPDRGNFFLNGGKFFNKLAGNATLMQQLKDGASEATIRKSWEPALSRFKVIRKKYLLYPDFD